MAFARFASLAKLLWRSSVPRALALAAAPRARALFAGGASAVAVTLGAVAQCDAPPSSATAAGQHAWPPVYRPAATCSEMSHRMAACVQEWQRDIVETMASVDGTQFKIDHWGNEHRNGTSCVLEHGRVFEKAAVNTTITRVADQPPERFKNLLHDHPQYQRMMDRGAKVELYTASMSLILHPWNPHAPTVHANYRYFELNNGHTEDRVFWFGGGGDLTPALLYDEDAHHFHATLRSACEAAGGPNSTLYYPKFKAWCDKYFFVKHRNETRGVGGIFFDNLHDESPEQLFKFVDSCANSFVPSYLPLVLRRKDTPFTDAQRQWQLQRRGRYVEFNLVYDKGTSYGLAQPGARIKSILVSLPATVEFAYDEIEPAKGTREAALLDALKTPREWVQL